MRNKNIAVGLIILGTLLLSGLVLVGFGRLFPIPSVRELPDQEIHRTFEMVAGYKLPTSVKNLRAIFWDRRDAAIFVAFETDAEGVAYVKATFGGSSVKEEILGDARLRGLVLSGWEPFGELSDAEERLGVRLFRLESIESALLLRRHARFGFPGYTILIDIENSIVYVQAVRLL